MKVTAWRLFKERHRATAFTGVGARIYGGRWNSIGTAVVYASETRSLALLETLVHLNDARFLSHFLLAEVAFDSSLVIRVPAGELAGGGRGVPPPPRSRSIGDEWVRHGRSAVLMVPSAVVEDEHNFLLNPAHLDFAHVEFGTPRPFAIDPRLA